MGAVLFKIWASPHLEGAKKGFRGLSEFETRALQKPNPHRLESPYPAGTSVRGRTACATDKIPPAPSFGKLRTGL